jgi:hypothetical protein
LLGTIASALRGAAAAGVTEEERAEASKLVPASKEL